MNSLSLRFEPDPHDCVGRLFVHVGTGSFSGSRFFWAQAQDLEEFATQLGSYPLSPDDLPTIRWGYNAAEGEDLLLFIQLSPSDRVGGVRVAVELAHPYEPENRVRTSFETTYSDIDRFRTALPPLVRGEEAKATLLGR